MHNKIIILFLLAIISGKTIGKAVLMLILGGIAYYRYLTKGQYEKRAAAFRQYIMIHFPVADFELVESVLYDFYKKREASAKERILSLMNSDPALATYLGCVFLYYEGNYDDVIKNLTSLNEFNGFLGFGDYYFLLAASYKAVGDNAMMNDFIRLAKQSQTFMFNDFDHLNK